MAEGGETSAVVATNKGVRPRQYQQELFEEACKRNILAFIDTGAGKTLIAILLIRHKAEELYEGGVKKKVTVFLAPKVGLVLQQASVLREHTGMETRGYVGSMGVDLWKAHEWRKQMAHQEIMVMTHDILLNSLRHGFMKMLDINLLIFDEAHHAKKNHPYNVIMREFYFDPQIRKKLRPHIFGMTASPLDSKLTADQAKITAFFQELEGNLDSKVVTVADRSLLETVAPLPASEIVHFPRLDVEPVVQDAIKRLQMLGEELRAHGDLVRSNMQQRAIQMQGLNKLGLAFDAEKLKTECHTFARFVQSVVETIEELGLLPAAQCLLEVLKPVARNISKAELHRARRREAALAASYYREADLDVEGIEDDAWWEGHNLSLRTRSDYCSMEEVAKLNSVMWRVVREFRQLLAPKATGWQELSEEEAVEAGWPRVCIALEAAMERILAAADWAALGRKLWQLADASAWGEQALLTPKVAALLLRLRECQGLAEEQRKDGARWSGIVFCHRKFTVTALDWLMRNLGPFRFLRTAAIMGSNGILASSGHLKRQQVVLERFKGGGLNLLLATAVAEEGLDLTRCRLVVRFDLPRTPLEFIQSRGRARARDSRLVLLVEAGRDADEEMLRAVHRCEESMRLEALQRRWQAGAGTESSSDDDSGDEAELLNAVDRSGPGWEYCVPATGARVSLTGAKTLMYHYCSCLPTDSYTVLQPRFSTLNLEPGKYRAKVILPNNAPLQIAEGVIMPTKSTAIGSACLAAIEAIHQVGGFSDYLLPALGIQTSSRDAFGDFDLAPVVPVGLAKEGEPLRPASLCPKRPDVLAWPLGSPCSTAKDSTPVNLFLYRLKLSTEKPAARAEGKLGARQAERLAEVEGQPLGLLMPQALPELPPVPVELVPGLVTVMRVEPCGQHQFSLGQYNAARTWHRLLLPTKSVAVAEPASKKRKLDDAVSAASEAQASAAEQSSPDSGWYCLVPLAKHSSTQHAGAVVNWADITRVGRSTELFALDWQNMTAEQVEAELQGCAVCTTHNKLTYDVLGVERGMTEEDNMPLGVDLRRRTPNISAPELPTQQPTTFKDYYRTRWQTVLQPTTFMLRCTSKHILRRQEGATGRELKYGEASVLLPPQLCLVHPLKCASMLAAKYVPSLLWWIHTLLLAAELRKQLSPPARKQPSLLLLAQALTPAFSHPHANFERLETLGDAFLKYDSCVHAFFAFPKAHEGLLAESKQAVISNKNLGILGRRLGLLQYMSNATEYMDWVTGANHEARKISSKVVADCMEGLIGCYYVAGGEQVASDLLRRLGILPPMPQAARDLPPAKPQDRSPLAKKLEALLGYTFRDLDLLKEACTHCSWPDQSSACYQRLEFLGDAALDLLISRYYIIGHRDVEPGKLHDLRSASVNNTRLAIIAAWNSFHAFLRYCSPRLFGEISAFVDSVRKAKRGDFQDLKSRSYLQRMLQFSVRDYKRRGHGTVTGRLTIWAGNDPSQVRFPPAIRPASLQPPANCQDARRKSHRGQGDRSNHPGDAALHELLSAGFGVGFSAAPKVLGDLFESILGAVFVDSGASLDVLWQVVNPFLQPMVHPDKVPVHPVRAIQELAQQRGLQACFRREPCDQPGCFSMATVVSGRIIGKCDSAQTRDHARMLAADIAVQNWSDSLVAELQQLQRLEAAVKSKADESAKPASKKALPALAEAPTVAEELEDGEILEGTAGSEALATVHSPQAAPRVLQQSGQKTAPGTEAGPVPDGKAGTAADAQECSTAGAIQPEVPQPERKEADTVIGEAQAEPAPKRQAIMKGLDSSESTAVPAPVSQPAAAGLMGALKIPTEWLARMRNR